MELRFELHGEQLIVHVGGQLDMAAANRFVEEMEKMLEKDPKDLVFDMAQVEFMDSTGIGKLIRIIEQAKGKNVRCSIVHCREELNEVLDLIGVFQLLEE